MNCSAPRRPACVAFFFFNDTATTEIYTLSLHDALPICPFRHTGCAIFHKRVHIAQRRLLNRSEEHTSELQSQSNLVCRLLLEKKTVARETSDRTQKCDQIKNF